MPNSLILQEHYFDWQESKEEAEEFIIGGEE
jgi:hypothetical protein